MNAFLKKEIRLLLPSWIGILVLAILAPWFWKDPDASFAWTPCLLFFGMALLAVDSFGREFSLGTFSGLMAQPVERRRVWQTKISILFSAAVLIFAAYFVSSEMVFWWALKIAVWGVNPKILTADFHHALLGAAAAIFLALTGGLWTTLLIRQIAAALWITFLTPFGVLLLLIFFLPAKWSDDVLIPLLCVLGTIYCLAGFWLARRLFYRAQDAAWTGGVISFSKWRYYEAGMKNSISVRRRKPFSALCKKEFQLHSISLFCAGALLALHLGVFFMRAVHGRFENNSLGEVTAEMFWIFWLVMPLVIGCTAVAEERKLGVVNEQFCQPVSRRAQFAVKFFPAMFFGVLFGGVVPLVLESIAARLGLPNSFLANNSFSGASFISGFGVFLLSLFLGAAGLTLAAFWASTLAKNFLQALSIAIVGAAAFFMFFVVFTARQNLDNGVLTRVGAQWWGAVLPVLMGILTMAVFVPWLAWRNFNHFSESGRLWRRNIFGVIGAVVFVFGSSALIYHRVWEVFEPAEPPHGAAKFDLSNPPKLQGSGDGGLQVRFPDGRIWCDNLKSYWNEEPDRWKLLWQALVYPLPDSGGPEQFLADANWISTAAGHRVYLGSGGVGYLDSVGVQANGTLWISSEAKPRVWTGADMTRFGDETNWRQVVSIYDRYFLLLKTDGTLWQWKSPQPFDWSHWRKSWPTVRNSQPQRIGTNSDWREIVSAWGGLARKTDGSVWSIYFENNGNEIKITRDADLDHANLKTLSRLNDDRMAYIGEDGTLWLLNWTYDPSAHQWHHAGFLQVGAETNWVAAAINWNRLVALKTDGTLWQWKLTASAASTAQSPPTRLGIHNDWIGLASVWDGVVTLAADGSLWFWPDDGSSGTLLKAPKQPKLLANVLGKSN